METEKREERARQNQRRERTQMRRLRWHRWVWNNLMEATKPFVRMRYGSLRMEPAPAVEGSYIVLPNHTCGADQFLVAYGFPKRHMYFMASEHSFRNPILGPIMRIMTGAIARMKGSVDASAVLTVLRWLRRGVPICIFPEGNRSWNGRTGSIHPTTAKFLRSAGVPVITYRIEGGYLTDPRWSRTLRRGTIRGRAIHVYPPEELRKMTPAEIETHVAEDLHVDTDVSQKEAPIAYRGKKLAEGLEEALFLCPQCGKIGGLSGKGDRFSCTCGLQAVYNAYGFFEGDRPFPSVAAWDDWQRQELHRLAAEESFFLSDPNAEIRQVRSGRGSRIIGKGQLRVDRSGIRVGERFFPLRTLQQPELCHLAGSETLMFTNPEGSYEVRLAGRQSRRKYHLLLTELLSAEHPAT